MTARTQAPNGVGGWSSSALRQMAARLLAVTVVAALALSSLGPMIDHHFVERHPGHVHLFFGPSDPGHSHDFNSAHIHDPTGMYGPVPGLLDHTGPGDIAYFMPNDGIGYGSADLTIPFVERSLRLPWGDSHGLLGAASSPYAIMKETTVIPPTHPPLA